jgi:colicin import membrane protein
VSERSDNLGAFLLSLAVHVLLVVGLWLATLSCASYNTTLQALNLPLWMSMTCSRPLNLEGPVIEASLVDYTSAPRAKIPQQRPKIEKPAAPPKPKIESKPELDTPDPVVQPAEDQRDQERIDRLALEKAQQEQKEQEELHRREQLLLEERERQTRIQQERQQQLKDIQRQREEAERAKQREQQRLAQLEDREMKADPALRAGNEGTDNDLLSRYQFAIQSKVKDAWNRPDTVRPGLRCTLAIIQIPGGEVISAAVVAPCDADDQTKRSLEEAAFKAQPFPYQGFESVFQRSIRFNFRYDG